MSENDRDRISKSESERARVSQRELCSQVPCSKLIMHNNEREIGSKNATLRGRLAHKRSHFFKEVNWAMPERMHFFLRRTSLIYSTFCRKNFVYPVLLCSQCFLWRCICNLCTFNIWDTGKWPHLVYSTGLGAYANCPLSVETIFWRADGANQVSCMSNCCQPEKPGRAKSSQVGKGRDHDRIP